MNKKDLENIVKTTKWINAQVYTHMSEEKIIVVWKNCPCFIEKIDFLSAVVSLKPLNDEVMPMLVEVSSF